MKTESGGAKFGNNTRDLILEVINYTSIIHIDGLY